MTKRRRLVKELYGVIVVGLAAGVFEGGERFDDVEGTVVDGTGVFDGGSPSAWLTERFPTDCCVRQRRRPSLTILFSHVFGFGAG